MASLSPDRLRNEQYRQGGFTQVTAATTLTTLDRTVELNNSAAYTVTLPPAAEAMGLTFTFRQTTGTSLDVVLSDGGNSQGRITEAGGTVAWVNYIFTTTSADYESLMLYCDGRYWWDLSAKLVA